MLFRSRETKFRKAFKGKRYNRVRGCYHLGNLSELETKSYKSVALVSLEQCRVKERLLFTIRQHVVKKIKRKGLLKINMLADIPVSKKPLEIRMGKGKGAVNFFSYRLSPGHTLVEIHGFSPDITTRILFKLQKKLPFKTKVVYI